MRSRGESSSHSHAQSIAGGGAIGGGGGVLSAQLRRRPVATAAAGHPPLTAAAAAATVVVYVSRHPCIRIRTARRHCASAGRTPAPRRAHRVVALHPARTVSTRRRRSERISHCGARVVLCSFVSCSPHQTRARRCIVRTHVSVLSVFPFFLSPSVVSSSSILHRQRVDL